MHKVNCTTQMVEIVKHEFYCDDCGKYLGTSEEYDDGYYESLGVVYHSIYLKGIGRYKVYKHLCDNCQEKYVRELKETLKKFGFKEDE